MRRGLLVSGIFLTSAIASFVASASLAGDNQVKLGLAYLLFLFGCFGLLLDVLSNHSIDMFSPTIMFPIVFVTWYGVGGLELTRWERPTDLVYYQSFFLGILSYWVGIALSHVVFKSRLQGNPFIVVRWRLANTRLFAYALLLLGTACFAIIVSRFPFARLWSTEVEQTRTEVIRAVGGYIYFGARLLQIAFIFQTIRFFLLKEASMIGSLAIWLYCLGLLSLLGARRMLAEPLLVSVVLYHYCVRRIRVSFLIPMLSIGIALFVAAGYFRFSGGLNIDSQGMLRIMLIEIKRVADAFVYVAELVPSKLDFLGLRAFLMSFATVLPGEQPNLGNVLKAALGLSFRGGPFVPGILGGFYVAYGNAGIVGGMLFCGFLLNAVYRWGRKSGRGFSYLVYSYVVVDMLIAIRGMFLLDVWPMFVVLVFFAADVFCRLKLPFRSGRIEEEVESYA